MKELNSKFQAYSMALFLSFLFIFQIILTGCNNSESEVKAPVIEVFDSNPKWGDAPLHVTFYWNIYGSEKSNLTCELDVDGDGNTDFIINNCSSSNTIPYTYNNSGIFHPKLIVTNEKGNKAEKSIEVYSNRLKFADNVIFPESIKGFKEATLNGDELTLEFEDGSKLPSIKQGDILWGKTGYGYLKKVISVSKSSNKIVIQTSQAKIDEAITYGTFGVRDYYLQFTDIKCIENCENVKSARISKNRFITNNSKKAPLEGEISVGVDLEFDIPINNKEGKEITELKINIGASIKIEKFVIDIGLDGLKEFTLKVEPSVEPEISASLSKGVIQMDRPLGKWALMTIPIGPIIIVPNFNPKLYLQADLNLELLDFGASVSFDTLAEVSYKDGKTNAYITPDISASFNNPSFGINYSTKTGGDVKVAIAPGFDFLIFDVLGPFISPYLYVKGEVELKGEVDLSNFNINKLGTSVCLTGKMGVECKFGAHFDLFSLYTISADATANIAELQFYHQCFDNSVLDAGIEDDAVGYDNYSGETGVDYYADIGYIEDAEVDGSDTSSCEKTDPKHIWSKRFGGSSDDRGYSVSVDSSGNVYITGWFVDSTIDFGGGALTNAGGSDIFLAKFDSNGNHKWSKRFGGSNWDYGNSVSVDSSGNVYITGGFESSTIDFGGGALTNAGGNCKDYPCSDIFLAKFDSNGNHKWSRRFGGGNDDWGTSVSVDSSGNVYITGYFNSSTIDFGGGALTNAGYSDIFLAKFDSNGNHLWSKSFGGSSDDYGYSVSVDSSGNVYITGGFESSTIDFGGGTLTNAYIGIADIFLAKFDSNGKHLWSKRFGGSYGDYGSSVSVDSSGNVYITGYFWSSTIDFGGGALTNAGGSDIFLAKFDSNGNHLWSKRFGGSDNDYGNSVSVDSSGNVYITGYFYSSTIDFGGGALTNAGWADIFLAKFDSNGNHLWSKRFGGSGYDEGNSVSVDSSGNVYGTGLFTGSNIDFGGCPLSSAGGHNIYLIKFAP